MAIPLFCRRINITKPGVLNEKGPILLACNHPNSFLDGIILNALFEQQLYSLARGDVFKNNFYSKLLTALHLLPVFRISEGAKNLKTNYDTFETCKNIFRGNGIVIIFSEGKCINEWHLRPLKKGTARLATECWNENIPLRIIPVGINYSSFRRFGKNVFINFGDVIEKHETAMDQSEGMRYRLFNQLLEKKLMHLVFEIDKKDKTTQQRLLEKKPTKLTKLILYVPAIIGLLIHWPVYTLIRNFTYNKTRNNEHYDAVLTGLLLIAYPLYIGLFIWIVFFFTESWLSFLLMLLMPFTAWSYIQLKPQLDK